MNNDILRERLFEELFAAATRQLEESPRTPADTAANLIEHHGVGLAFEMAEKYMLRDPKNQAFWLAVIGQIG